jgi:hypothetical protein
MNQNIDQSAVMLAVRFLDIEVTSGFGQFFFATGEFECDGFFLHWFWFMCCSGENSI